MGIKDFFEEFKKDDEMAPRLDEEYGQKQIDDERNKIKNDIKKNFKEQLGFTDMEIREILMIVDKVETEINKIKSQLNNVYNNTSDTEDIVDEAEKKINQIAIGMNLEIKKKTIEILERKKGFGNQKK